MINLDIVIVTFNRLDKLRKTLQHYSDQTVHFRNLIIVNNCSTDGTGLFLAEWTDKNKNNAKFTPILINATENLGGSGGFYLGEKKRCHSSLIGYLLRMMMLIPILIWLKNSMNL